MPAASSTAKGLDCMILPECVANRDDEVQVRMRGFGVEMGMRGMSLAILPINCASEEVP